MSAAMKLGDRARYAASKVEEMRADARSRLCNEIFDLVRLHFRSIVTGIEGAVLAASENGCTTCEFGYDGISFRDFRNPPPRQEDIDRLGPILELKSWALSEGLRLEVVLEAMPATAIGFDAMRYPRLLFRISWQH